MIRSCLLIGLCRGLIKLGGTCLSGKALVSERGAVLLGDSVACDAFEVTRPLRVVTHAHADHLVGLRQSLRSGKKVLMTRATRDLVDVMNGQHALTNGHVETLDYGDTIAYDNEQVTLAKADHILGAAQVLVEDSKGSRVAYTGDFKLDGTQPLSDTTWHEVEPRTATPPALMICFVEVKELLVSMV